MSEETKDPRRDCPPPAVDSDLACDECGAFGAFVLGDAKLCLRCYAEKGSCCPEFGKDDLWAKHEREA